MNIKMIFDGCSKNEKGTSFLGIFLAASGKKVLIKNSIKTRLLRSLPTVYP